MTNTENFKRAKEVYKKGSSFLSATGLINTPLVVTAIKLANHEDRKSEIKSLKLHILSIWNLTYPKRQKDDFKKLDFNNSDFISIVLDQMAQLKELESLSYDIVEESGGIIYDSLTNNWAIKTDLL